jgi:hypothetical protein
MIVRSYVVAIIASFAFASQVSAAPQGMLDKTITISFEASIPARNAAGQALTARRAVQRVMYVSSAGRVFSRTARQAGRASETKDVAPGGADGAPRIEGNTIVGTLGFGTGASRMIVSFDGAFQSCAASVIVGRESGRALTWKGIDGNVYTATGPASVSTPSCAMQPGNAFAGR